MKRRQSSMGSMGKDKVAIKGPAVGSKRIPGKKSEPDVTPDKKAAAKERAKKLEGRQL